VLTMVFSPCRGPLRWNTNERTTIALATQPVCCGAIQTWLTIGQAASDCYLLITVRGLPYKHCNKMPACHEGIVDRSEWPAGALYARPIPCALGSACLEPFRTGHY